MSEGLVLSIPPKSTSCRIAQFDEECEKFPTDQEFQLFDGPLSVFRIRDNRPLPAVKGTESHAESTDHSRTGDHESCDNLLDPRLQFWDQMLDQIVFDGEELAVACADLELQTQITWTSSIDLDGFGAIANSASNHESAKIPMGSVEEESLMHVQDSPSLMLQLTENKSAIPENGLLLLQHYIARILGLFTPFEHNKTPWHILFVPHIKNCFAALALSETLDHASLSAFYGTLAISALSLGHTSKSPTLIQQGKSFQQNAAEHTQMMLRTAYGASKTAKYKSSLISLLTMIQVSTFAGSRDQVEYYFVEAEKLIRLKGLNRKKSRKVRLLHHCYAFERIFYETTLVSDKNSKYRDQARRIIESSGLIIHGQDSISFRLPSWRDLDTMLSTSKSQEEGENDLHLEKPGLFAATLYPEIFGVPEEWMYLLSLVIRLGREKDGAGLDGSGNSCGLKDFLDQAKAAEKRINQLKWTEGMGHHEQDGNKAVVVSMLDALRNALAIYFYRRVYDIDSSMLQARARKVHDCLLHCRTGDVDKSLGTSRFIWPAFVAACEAENPELQVSFSNWFKDGARQSGLKVFTATLREIERTWNVRRGGKGWSTAWLKGQ